MQTHRIRHDPVVPLHGSFSSMFQKPHIEIQEQLGTGFHAEDGTMFYGKPLHGQLLR